MNYKNIAISSQIAAGKSTLLRNLRTHLEPLGWKMRSTGQIIRDYTKENVLPLSTLVSEEFDRKIEGEVERLFREGEKNVVEGWLAGFIAREITTTFKVLLICSDFSIRVDRVANRDSLSIEKAKDSIKIREEENFKKWKKMYGDYDFFDPSYFNLIVDTYSMGPMETLGRVLDKVGYKS